MLGLSFQITTNLSWLVRMVSDLETQVVSVERVKEYTEIATEVCMLFFRYLVRIIEKGFMENKDEK